MQLFFCHRVITDLTKFGAPDTTDTRGLLGVEDSLMQPKAPPRQPYGRRTNTVNYAHPIPVPALGALHLAIHHLHGLFGLSHVLAQQVFRARVPMTGATPYLLQDLCLECR